jgi:hypothetical protein
LLEAVAVVMVESIQVMAVAVVAAVFSLLQDIMYQKVRH